MFIPERPPSAVNWQDSMCNVLEGVGLSIFSSLFGTDLRRLQHRIEGKRKTIVIVAEGAHDCLLNPITPDEIKDVLTKRLGLDTRVTTLGHTQRGGKPAAYDRILVSRPLRPRHFEPDDFNRRLCKELKRSKLCSTLLPTLLRQSL